MTTRLLRSTGSSLTKVRDLASFFHYTTGRWIDNESTHLQKRYLRFDIEGLKAATVSAVNGAASVLQITKLAEGSYCKVFSLLLDNHKEVIARLPTPFAGPGHLITASEVATMEFARTRIGIPVPRVLSWSRNGSANTVGSEFIIMEKASGVELGKVWDDLTPKNKILVVEEVAKIEMATLKYPFPAYGSLFFRNDIQPGMDAIPVDDIFVIGTCMQREFWQEISSTMKHNRGPWVHPTQYLDSIYRRELQLVKSGSYITEQSLRDTWMIEQDSSKVLSLLNQFASVIRYIVPTTSPEFILPTLYHHDLNGGNIFISESELAEGRILITSVIDWQSTAILPLYLRAKTPEVFRYHSPWNLPPGFSIPPLPTRAEHASEAEFQAAVSDCAGKLCELKYRSMFHEDMPVYYEALIDPQIQTFAGVAQTAVSMYDDNIYYLREYLIRLQTDWPYITSDPCPLCISDEEKWEWRSEGKKWQDHQNQIEELRDMIGVNKDGWVHAEDFGVVYRRYKLLKKEWLRKGGLEDDWPFSGPEKAPYGRLHR